MRIVTVPAPIKVALASRKDLDPTDISLKDFLTTHLDGYSAVKTPSQVRQVCKIMDAVEKGNGTMAFEDADFEVVKGAVQEGGKYVPGVARQLIAFYDALDNAETLKA